MLLPISNEPRPYAWGDERAIADLLGREPSGSPEAELWLGAHAGSPSQILAPDQAGGAADLAEWIGADPATALGADRSRLPFLLKVLAAAAPLSLQAHPTSALAVAGFEREQRAGVPVDAPERNYRDQFHKPELIFALSDEFHALCGFRPLERTRRILDALAAPGRSRAVDALRASLDEPTERKALRLAVRRLLTEDVGAEVEEIAALAAAASDERFALEFETVASLQREYPGDPGVVVALLLNRVVLRRGEVLSLPAGNIHAYLAGLGIELMAASDNVLRGGLTAKHIDVPELLSVLDFTPMPAPTLAPRLEGDARVFAPDVPDFSLVHLAVPAGEERRVRVPGPAILLVTEGRLRVDGARSGADLARGDARYVTPDEAELTLTGGGTAFLATVGQ